MEYDALETSPEDELKLNIQGLLASTNGKGQLANTIWSLIDLKGYERLDYIMTLEQMYLEADKRKIFK